MKLYVCYGTWKPAPRPGGHPCGTAYHALKDAGYEPEVVRSYGIGILPDALNQTPGRKEVRRLTGNNWVPVLVLDDGTAIQGSRKIADWAKANRPGQRSPGTTPAPGPETQPGRGPETQPGRGTTSGPGTPAS